MAQDLNTPSPLDAQMQVLWLPAIRAQVALDRKNPPAAKQFLALWKDADSDIPILKQAKTEYARLQ
jgi:hypothetical protein